MRNVARVIGVESVALIFLTAVGAGGCDGSSATSPQDAATDGRGADQQQQDVQAERDQPQQDEARQVFVTSVRGTGDFSSWPDSGGKSGLAGADAVCQARAVAAGWSGTFVAWLSDSKDDAYCRVHGLSGKRSAACGQATVPQTAGPWVRTDGLAWGGRIDKLLDSGNPHVYTPIALDELGQPADAFFGNTAEDGTLDKVSCKDWTSADGSEPIGTMGSVTMTGTVWSVGGSSADCDHSRPILCMEVGAGPDEVLPQPAGKGVFLTTKLGSGDLSSWASARGKSGVAAGDAVCRTLAQAAGLADADKFKAWLSDGSVDAIDRLSSAGPWVRLDGIVVATSRSDLTDGTLLAPINVTEQGGYSGRAHVWTGTDSKGIAVADTCGDWQVGDTTAKTIKGRSYDAGPSWTKIGTTMTWSCVFNHALYCFED